MAYPTNAYVRNINKMYDKDSKIKLSTVYLYKLKSYLDSS